MKELVNNTKEFIKGLTPKFLFDLYHQFLPFLGAVVYGFPSRKLIVIGITGTNGKTTVVDWTARILEEAGNKVASVSSVRFRIGEKEWPNMLKMTMPGRMKLQKFLRDAVNAGCRYAVVEVTSEGIAQRRHSFIDFDVAVFTNLSPEHIERHGSFGKYRQAKGELFKTLKSEIRNPKPSTRAKLGAGPVPHRNEVSGAGSETNSESKIQNIKQKKISIVNLDDENAEYFLQFPAEEKWIFTRREIVNQSTRYSLLVTRYKTDRDGLKFAVGDTDFHLGVLGEFNVYNALAAISVGLSQGVDLEMCKRALEKAQGVPGRMEVVVKEPFTVIVDYAHTPVALENVYKIFAQPKSDILINKQDPKFIERPKLICVLGAAGGGRDKWKRPELGRIAARYCDAMILTNEDPYDEDPRRILFEIKSGIPNSEIPISGFYEILDRKEAIKKSLQLAKPGDAVVITGKGTEPWMCLANGKKIRWDDRLMVKEHLHAIL